MYLFTGYEEDAEFIVSRNNNIENLVLGGRNKLAIFRVVILLYYYSEENFTYGRCYLVVNNYISVKFNEIKI